jgi:hypothetical protein
MEVHYVNLVSSDKEEIVIDVTVSSERTVYPPMGFSMTPMPALEELPHTEGIMKDLYGTEAYINAEKPEEPEEYPTFEVGETVELKGYPFVVMRRNASSIKLRPVPPEGRISAKKTLRKMQVDRVAANESANVIAEFLNEIGNLGRLDEDRIRELRTALGTLRTAAAR